MHYVAVVPADLQSAGIKYKDLFNPLVVKAKCFVDSIQCNTIDNNLRSVRTMFANVPADLQLSCK